MENKYKQAWSVWINCEKKVISIKENLIISTNLSADKIALVQR